MSKIYLGTGLFLNCTFYSQSLYNFFQIVINMYRDPWTIITQNIKKTVRPIFIIIEKDVTFLGQNRGCHF